VTKCREIKLLCEHITTEHTWELVMLSGHACYAYCSLHIWSKNWHKLITWETAPTPRLKETSMWYAFLLWSRSVNLQYKSTVVTQWWVSRILPISAAGVQSYYRGADKSLAWPGRKQATVTEDFDVHISYLLS